MERCAPSVAWLLSGMLALATLATSQDLTAVNYTNATMDLRNSDSISLVLDAQTIDGLEEWETSLLPATKLPLNNSAQGGTLLVDYTNAQNATNTIAYISCDPPSGIITQGQVLTEAIMSNPAGIILYTIAADYCTLSGYNLTFPYIFSVMNSSDATQLIKIVQTYGGSLPTEIWTYIAPTNVSNVKPNIMNNTSGNGSGGGGGTAGPTTAIAMIILYTITGVITVLFLTIIITGAVRAHRHPERYGLRAGVGRPRRSRAHGIARAMLDSLPIVKFGDREADQAGKPTELELGQTASHTSSGATEAVRGADGTADHTTPVSAAADASLTTQAAQATEQHPRSSAEQSSSSSSAAAAVAQQHESGITAAAAPVPVPDDAQGCSICTEDFELGQDIRVLPCDHRFHPACIDPWLLNVSGTCPLCRIDLHPRRGSNDSVSDDENDGGPLAPPLGLQQGDAAATRRLSIRRSIMIGLMGIGGGARPENMSREERVLALRQLRGQQAARRRREELESVAATPEEESRLRTRLRGVFHRSIRRSRIEGSMATVNEGSASSAAATAPSAPSIPSAPSAVDTTGSRAAAPDTPTPAEQRTGTPGADTH